MRGGGGTSYKRRKMFRDFITNVTLLAAVASWVAAQFIKLLAFVIRERRFDYGFLFRLGIDLQAEVIHVVAARHGGAAARPA